MYRRRSSLPTPAPTICQSSNPGITDGAYGHSRHVEPTSPGRGAVGVRMGSLWITVGCRTGHASGRVVWLGKGGPVRSGRAPFRGNEPVLIPMYALTSWRSPPSRPFLNLLRFLVHFPGRCLVRALLDCPPLLSAHFVSPTASTVNPRCLGRGVPRRCRARGGAPAAGGVRVRKDQSVEGARRGRSSVGR
jgi:hypothetical protein